MAHRARLAAIEPLAWVARRRLKDKALAKKPEVLLACVAVLGAAMNAGDAKAKEAVKKATSSAKVAESTAKVMRSEAKNVQAQELGMRVMVASVAGDKAISLPKEAPAAVLAAMRANGMAGGIQALGCKFLAGFSAADDASCKMAAEMGGAEHAIEAMKRFLSGSPSRQGIEVVADGAHALQAMSKGKDDDKGTQKRRDRVAAAGAPHHPSHSISLAQDSSLPYVLYPSLSCSQVRSRRWSSR